MRQLAPTVHPVYGYARGGKLIPDRIFSIGIPLIFLNYRDIPRPGACGKSENQFMDSQLLNSFLTQFLRIPFERLA